MSFKSYGKLIIHLTIIIYSVYIMRLYIIFMSGTFVFGATSYRLVCISKLIKCSICTKFLIGYTQLSI